MPPKNVGTLTLADLLKNTNQSPVQFGLDAIMTVVDRDLATHNRLTTDLVSTFADITTDVRRRYGVSDTIEFRPADEFTRAHTQKVGAQAVVEFPLENDQAALGWTAMFFRQKSVADLARSQIAAQRGHLLSIRQKLMQAMFGATNYTFTDYLDTQIDLGVKRFVNADGAPIPDGPNAVQFDGTTHTHYLWTAGLSSTSTRPTRSHGARSLISRRTPTCVSCRTSRADRLSRVSTRSRPTTSQSVCSARPKSGKSRGR
jgi:hypothetical protein